MRERQSLACLRIVDDGIVLHTLHYADEVLPLEDSLPGTVAKAKPADKELTIAQQLIDAMTKPLDVSTFRDDYREKLEKLIESKRSGKTMRIASDSGDEAIPKNINLMEALKRSLAANKPSRSTTTRHPRRKSA